MRSRYGSQVDGMESAREMILRHRQNERTRRMDRTVGVLRVVSTWVVFLVCARALLVWMTK